MDVRTADEHRIRRYGFHGTSHAYVSRERRCCGSRASRPSGPRWGWRSS
ncbi:hypothetical protein [Streptomyces sp. NPDC004976]